ncbi:uncharacterized protein LOC129319609 [Prosopis cineraria]|uniref:uncharacterized protein LOC129319609 n=1 Tax=Prosopis cineraria TaxID=364024 RepID=UPI0024108733|nr:uncharacterized protein LOC129319609 [Prosopis cineraria]
MDQIELVLKLLEEDEEEKNQEWLVNLLELLIGDGESPFLKNISRCLASRYLDLVKVCLLTVTWLSSRLPVLNNSGSPLPAFSAIIYQMKGILQSADLELKTLASLSLFSFQQDIRKQGPFDEYGRRYCYTSS